MAQSPSVELPEEGDIELRNLASRLDAVKPVDGNTCTQDVATRRNVLPGPPSILEPSPTPEPSALNSPIVVTPAVSSNPRPGTHRKNLKDRWQCPLNLTQTLSGLVAMIMIFYMFRPQMEDHALNEWSALVNFRDDCRAQEARNQTLTTECVKALSAALPGPPIAGFRRLLRRSIFEPQAAASNIVMVTAALISLSLAASLVFLWFWARYHRSVARAISWSRPLERRVARQYTWVPLSTARAVYQSAATGFKHSSTAGGDALFIMKSTSDFRRRVVSATTKLGGEAFHEIGSSMIYDVSRSFMRPISHSGVLGTTPDSLWQAAFSNIKLEPQEGDGWQPVTKGDEELDDQLGSIPQGDTVRGDDSDASDVESNTSNYTSIEQIQAVTLLHGKPVLVDVAKKSQQESQKGEKSVIKIPRGPNRNTSALNSWNDQKERKAQSLFGKDPFMPDEWVRGSVTPLRERNSTEWRRSKNFVEPMSAKGVENWGGVVSKSPVYVKRQNLQYRPSKAYISPKEDDDSASEQNDRLKVRCEPVADDSTKNLDFWTQRITQGIKEPNFYLERSSPEVESPLPESFSEMETRTAAKSFKVSPFAMLKPRPIVLWGQKLRRRYQAIDVI